MPPPPAVRNIGKVVSIAETARYHAKSAHRVSARAREGTRGNHLLRRSYFAFSAACAPFAEPIASSAGESAERLGRRREMTPPSPCHAPRRDKPTLPASCGSLPTRFPAECTFSVRVSLSRRKARGRQRFKRWASQLLDHPARNVGGYRRPRSNKRFNALSKNTIQQIFRATLARDFSFSKSSQTLTLLMRLRNKAMAKIRDH